MEFGGADGTKNQIEEGVVADFVIAGENTNFTIRNESKGVLWIKLHAKGVTAHGGYPWLGENAVWKMIIEIQKLLRRYPVPKRPAWQTTVNVARIDTPNITFNKIPSECNAYLDIRYVAREEKSILRKIKRILSKNVVIEIDQYDPPAYTKEDNPFIAKLQNSAISVLKKNPEIIGANGASDVRFYTNTGSAGVEFGPFGANHHSDEEWVDIKSLGDYYQILKNFLLSLS